MEFIRFGGLSKVNYKNIYKLDSFHSPPVKYGIYAFVFPYVEHFLWRWKLLDNKKLKALDDNIEEQTKLFKQYYRQMRRQFTYNGFLWTHCIDQAIKLKITGVIRNSWINVHTSDFKRILNLIKHDDMVTSTALGNTNRNLIKDPYKRGLGGFYGMDHLEVFIEKIN